MSEIFFLKKTHTRERSIAPLKDKRISRYYVFVSHSKISTGEPSISVYLSKEFMRDFGINDTDYVLIGIVNNLFVVKKSNKDEGWKLTSNRADLRNTARVKITHRVEFPEIKRYYPKSDVLIAGDYAYFECENKI